MSISDATSTTNCTSILTPWVGSISNGYTTSFPVQVKRAANGYIVQLGGVEHIAASAEGLCKLIKAYLKVER